MKSESLTLDMLWYGATGRIITVGFHLTKEVNRVYALYARLERFGA